MRFLLLSVVRDFLFYTAYTLAVRPNQPAIERLQEAFLFCPEEK
jgi:hypothetical protein